MPTSTQSMHAKKMAAMQRLKIPVVNPGKPAVLHAGNFKHWRRWCRFAGQHYSKDMYLDEVVPPVRDRTQSSEDLRLLHNQFMEILKRDGLEGSRWESMAETMTVLQPWIEEFKDTYGCSSCERTSDHAMRCAGCERPFCATCQPTECCHKCGEVRCGECLAADGEVVSEGWIYNATVPRYACESCFVEEED